MQFLKVALILSCVLVCYGYQSPQQPQNFLEVENKVESVPKERQAFHFSPVSTTMQCVISLTIQYMITITALGICRTYLDLTGQKHETSRVQIALNAASNTCFYAPMLSVLFVACRMRVLQLSEGKGNPELWVQYSMLSCTYAVLTSTLLALVIPIFTSSHIELDEHTKDIKMDHQPFENKLLATLFTVVKYLVLIAMYVGFALVIAGVFTYVPPSGRTMAISPAVSCTMNLSIQFFTIYFLLSVARTYTQFTQGEKGQTKFETALQCSIYSMNFAPMLCILFLGARMRALNMDPVNGNPQGWAQNCFYLCSYAVLVQTVLAIAVPLFLGGKAAPGTVEGDMQYSGVNETVGKVLTVCRYVIMLSIYLGFIAVMCSVFTIQHKLGAKYTPSVSPTMQCVIFLTSQYFLIYFIVWVSQTIKDLTGKEWVAMRQAVESARSTVSMAPMLCVLFVATRMRALQITENKGSPQGWAQQSMFLITWAVLIQFLMCLLLPLFTGESYEADTLDGRPAKQPKINNAIGAYTVVFFRYLAMVFLYVGAVCVITSVFLITPENANGSGKMPLIGDYVNPPPTVGEVPGVKTGMEAVGDVAGTAQGKFF